MKYLTVDKIRKGLDLHQYKDDMRITQHFKTPSTRYTIGYHTGLDVGENNRMSGDNLYAPFDGVVTFGKSWAGWNIGWQVQVESDPITIDGIRFVLRVNYVHTRGKGYFKDGDKVKKGDVVDKSGGWFRINAFWTGPHTHIEMMPRYDNGDKDPHSWQPNWQNGSIGFEDPLAFLAPTYTMAELEGKDVKLKDSPIVYLIVSGKRFSYPDEVAYSARGRVFARDLLTISSYDMDRFPYAGILGIDYEKNEALVAKQLLGLLADNPTRAKELKKKYF